VCNDTCTIMIYVLLPCWLLSCCLADLLDAYIIVLDAFGVLVETWSAGWLKLLETGVMDG
jgi:hypothetical protein